MGFKTKMFSSKVCLAQLPLPGVRRLNGFGSPMSTGDVDFIA